MEHLLHFGDSFSVDVPLYSDIQDLAGHDLAGWDKQRLQSHGDFQGHSEPEIAAFFQSWLYFGVLQEFFRDVPDFDLRDFVRLDEYGRRFVTTAKLQYWLIEWFSHHQESLTPQQAQRDLYPRIQSLLKSAYDVAILFCSVGRGAPYNGPVYRGVPDEISLSILVLFAALEKTTTRLTNLRFSFDLGNSRLLLNHLHNHGWCATDISWLALRNIDTVYTACTMDRPFPHLSHQECKPWECTSFQVDEKTYEQAHVKGCKGCSTKSVAIEELSAIISKDRIPLVSFDCDSHELKVESTPIAPDDINVDFMALSHVWSDGLGNPISNALHVCQLSRLQRLMNEAAASKEGDTNQLWYCDTLCIPVRGLDDENRRRAIGHMKNVYKRARRVLVLDQWLASRPRDTTAVEAYLNVLLCRWMRRLWTFDEGVLAEQILVQFQEGPASLDSLYGAMLNSRAPVFLYTWYDNDCIELLKPFIEGHTMEQNYGTAIYRTVSPRSTSRQSDETICLAHVMRLETDSLLKMDEGDLEGRMVQYLKLASKLPVSLLFQRLPRLSKSCFRWAPSSFLRSSRGSPTDIVYGDHADAEVTDTGALVDLPGIRINEKTNDTVLVVGHHFGLTIRINNVEKDLIVYYGPGENFDELVRSEDERSIRHPAIVCYHPLRSPVFESFDRGILVSVLRTEPDLISVRHVALVGLRMVPRTVFGAQQRKSQHFTVWHGTDLPTSTKWLIT